jgi:hypothetical protein
VFYEKREGEMKQEKVSLRLLNDYEKRLIAICRSVSENARMQIFIRAQGLAILERGADKRNAQKRRPPRVLMMEPLARKRGRPRKTQ